MVLDESVRLCLLNDFYGALLTKKQEKVLDSYLNFNIPISEIAKSQNTTRQAVLDTIKKGTKKLETFETKLEMLKKYLAQKQIFDDYKKDDELAKKIMKIWK